MNEPAIRRTSKLMATLLPAAKRIRAIDSQPRIIFSPRYGDPTRVNAFGSYMRSGQGLLVNSRSQGPVFEYA